MLGLLVLVLVLAAEAGAAVMPPRRLSPAKTIPAVTAAERLPNRCMIPPLSQAAGKSKLLYRGQQPGPDSSMLTG